jgi:type IV pilus assembly protein PilE
MKRVTGFTLIEVMITVAIIGIIAALAYPSYMDSIRKSNRSEAKVELMDAAQRLQRCYTSLSRFDDATNCPVYADLSGSGIVSRGSQFYVVTIAALGSEPTRTAYKLTALADKSPQTEDTGCVGMTLTSAGEREPEECW